MKRHFKRAFNFDRYWTVTNIGGGTQAFGDRRRPSTGAARRHAGEVEPLLITAADDDDGPEVTSSPRRVTNSSAVCRGVEMPRTDHGGGDVTRTIA